MKTKTIYIDLFGYRIYYLVCTLKEFQDYVYKHGCDIYNSGAASGMTVSKMDKTREIFVGLFDSNDKKSFIETIIHETIHVGQDILKYLNIPQGYENTELVANMYEYLIPKALELLKTNDKNKLSKSPRNVSKKNKKVLPKSKQLS